MTDYRKFYDEERYLLHEVGPHFRATGTIEPADFYMILIWKAERAKNKHKERLKKKAHGSFEAAVSKVASSLHQTPEQPKRLQILMTEWEFYIPTATAILTILYPEEFTVYDVRVCGQVDCDYKPWRKYSPQLWEDYERFREAVISNAPADLSLRDKDRFLVGRSFRLDVEKDCRD
jgi:hypothetical protein